MSFIHMTMPDMKKNNAVEPTTGHLDGGAKK
jgi:hypothetical protein